jgi:hypothetical protein
MMVYFCVNRKILKKHKKLSNVEVEYIKTVLLLVLVRKDMLFVMQPACKAMCKMLIGIESGFELAVII